MPPWISVTVCFSVMQQAACNTERHRSQTAVKKNEKLPTVSKKRQVSKQKIMI